MTQPTEYLKVSYSSLNVLESCARKFEFTKLMPRRVRDSDSFAADVGSALHVGYQTWLSHPEMDDETRLEAGMWGLLRKYPYAFEYMDQYGHRSLEACMATLITMIESAPMIEYELAQIKRPLTQDEAWANLEASKLGMELPFPQTGIIVPAVEVPFEIRFKGITLPDGRGIAFTGFIDAIMRNLVHGRYTTLDIKTHRSNLKDATAKYKFNGQQIPYGIVLEHIQGSPIDSFDVQYFDCFVDLTEARAELYEFPKDSTAVREWLVNKVLTFRRIQEFMEMGYFPRTEGGCVGFNRPCWFLEPCSSRDPEFLEAWLLMGEEASQGGRVEQPWIIAEIDLED